MEYFIKTVYISNLTFQNDERSDHRISQDYLIKC